MADDDRGLLAAVDGMIRASEALRETLAENVASLGYFEQRLREGRTLRAILAETPGSVGRERSKAAMERLDAARQEIRRELMRACLAQGMTRAEIAENYGFSHQVVSRYVKRDGREPPATKTVDAERWDQRP